MKQSKVFVFLACLATCSAMSSAASAAIESTPQDVQAKIGQMNNAFACALYRHLPAGDQNLFFSPLSVRTALAMTSAGARGQTAAEMESTLDLDDGRKAHEQLGTFLRELNDSGKQGRYELSVANALWGEKQFPFLPSYLEQVKQQYDGKAEGLNFMKDPQGSRKIINDWVSGQTHDKIRDLLPADAIVPETRLILTNAIYFMSAWETPFQESQTHDADFTTSGGKKIPVPFMHRQAHFAYAEDAGVQMLQLRYGMGDLVMQIFLPKTPDGLPAFEKSLTAEHLSALTQSITEEEVRLWLPRFKVEKSFELADVMKEMGMHRAFDANAADFSGMASAQPLYIARVIHKAFVSVDEKGTEAAAATAVTMSFGAARLPTPVKELRVNHPFLFTIVHQQSGAILFMGRVVNP